MKGVSVAGGTGSRLHRVARDVMTQLLPIHNQPMKNCTLSTLPLAGIREIISIAMTYVLPRFGMWSTMDGSWDRRSLIPSGLAKRGDSTVCEF
jgi:dTDP-glucose pyrophosphorylase